MNRFATLVALAIDGWDIHPPASSSVCFIEDREARFTQADIDRAVESRVGRLERVHAKNLDALRAELQAQHARELAASSVSGADASAAALQHARRQLADVIAERNTLARRAVALSVGVELAQRGVDPRAAPLLLEEGDAISWDGNEFQVKRDGETLFDARSVIASSVKRDEFARSLLERAASAPEGAKAQVGVAGAREVPEDPMADFGQGLEKWGRDEAEKRRAEHAKLGDFGNL